MPVPSPYGYRSERCSFFIVNNITPPAVIVVEEGGIDRSGHGGERRIQSGAGASGADHVVRS
jgi:hypothetical protein